MGYSFSNILNEMSLGLLGNPKSQDDLVREIKRASRQYEAQRIPTQQAGQEAMQTAMGFYGPAVNAANAMTGYDPRFQFQDPSSVTNPLLEELLRQQAKSKQPKTPWM